MIAPLIKSENCIKIFKLVEKSLEEYSSNNPYFKARQLLRFIKQKYPDISIAPQFLGKALEWLQIQGKVEKWGSSPPITWRKLEDGENGK